MSKQIHDWNTALSHYLSTYRWEIWLLIGIPAIAATVESAIHSGYTALVLASDSLPNWIYTYNNVRLFIEGLTLLLLAVSCTRVLGLGREFLALLWVYFMVVSLIWLAASGGHYLVRIDYFELNPAVAQAKTIPFAYIVFLPLYLAVLWFARQASRISLWHAYFLVALTMFVVVRPIPNVATEWGIIEIYGAFLVWVVATLMVMLLKVWLLGNFDNRGARFRITAIIGVIAATIAAGFIAILLVTLLDSGEGQRSVATVLYISAEGQLAEAPLLYTSWKGSVLHFFFDISAMRILLEIGVFLAIVYLVQIREPRGEAHKMGNSLQ